MRTVHKSSHIPFSFVLLEKEGKGRSGGRRADLLERYLTHIVFTVYCEVEENDDQPL
jgi:hypothetical protein